eukprot:UC4_evm3s330
MSTESDAGVCCAACVESQKGCRSFTFHTDSKQCWLHSSAAIDPSKIRWENNVISGVPPGTPLPPLPPRPPPAPPRGNMGVPSGPDACSKGTNGTKYPFCDSTLTMDKRLDDLVARVKLSDIAYELTARQSVPLDYLGVPSYYWGTNAIHGMQNVNCLDGKEGPCPTSFPAPCSLAASFNMSLTYDMGNVIGRELRAYYNAKIHNSLDTWSPTININRDPRWGRNVESPGEDPFLAGSYGTAYTKGLQQYTGEESIVQSVVTLKHFFAYSIENYNGSTRKNIDVKISEYDISTTYLPGWEMLVKEGKALGIMCSYNAVNGKATCGNPALNKTLREDWGFEGGDGPIIPPTNGSDAATRCLLGGTDIDSGGTYMGNLYDAIQGGELQEDVARLALRNSYKMRFKLGLFDPSIDNKYKKITTSVVGSDEHQAMSLFAAKKGMVLLKKGPLPFTKGKRVAVIGQSVSKTQAYTGNYDGPLCPRGGADCFPSIGQAINQSNIGGITTIVASTNVKDGAAAAKAADFVVLVVDNARDGGGEGHDRYTIGLSQDQIDVANAVIAANSNTVLVCINGGLISIDGLKDSAPAILEAFMPGVHGGTAISATIFGDNNPGGKLPVTMYKSNYVNEVDFLNMSMTAGPGRSYKYFSGEPLFPFGFGLSYTNFSLKWDNVTKPKHFSISTTQSEDEAVNNASYSCVVTNTGSVTGDEVVMAFIRPDPTSFQTLGDTPIEKKRLFAFKRVTLKPGASTTVNFDLEAEKHLTMVDSEGTTGIHPGKFHIVLSRGHGKELEAEATGNISMFVAHFASDQVVCVLKAFFEQNQHSHPSSFIASERAIQASVSTLDETPPFSKIGSLFSRESKALGRKTPDMKRLPM